MAGTESGGGGSSGLGRGKSYGGVEGEERGQGWRG